MKKKNVMINFEKIFLFFKKCSRQLIGNMKTLESVQKKKTVSVKKSNKKVYILNLLNLNIKV